jgi:regulator of sigma E protease
MLAGVFMNFLLAVGVYYFFIVRSDYRWEVGPDFRTVQPWFGEVETERVGDVEYSGLVEDMNAQEAGLPDEGVIESVDGEELVYSYELSEILNERKGEEVSIRVCEEDCVDYSVEVSDEGTIGIYLYQNYRVFLSYVNIKLFSGFAHAANVVGLVGDRFGEILSNANETGDYSEVVNNVSGPVGVYVIVDYFKQYGILSLIGFLADFSLTLAIMNILPIPALDGGRVLLVLIEAIIGRPLNKKLEAVIINVSFILLLALMVIIIFKDIFTIDQLRSLLK